MRCLPTNPTDKHPNHTLALSKTLAPEDVRRGQYVTLFDEIWEIPSFLWCEDQWRLTPEAPVRLQLLARDAGVPLKVKQVCLPFVLVKHPQGKARALDLRRCRLAQLQGAYAKAAWRSLSVRKP